MGNDITHIRVPITAKNKTTTTIPAKGPCEFEIPKRYDPDERRDSNLSNNKITIQEIDTAIYSHPDLNEHMAVPAPEPPPLGSLLFELRYETYEEQLNVHLIGARRLPVRHLVTEPGVASHGGVIKCDPMVEVCLLPEEKPVVESYTQFGIQDPQFDEHFSFKLTSAELNEKTLRFTVYDHKRRHRLTPIGHVLYSLKGQELDGAMIIERNLKLNSQPYGHTRGEILLSLNYNPGFNTITVGITKAKNLIHFDAHSNREYYVKVTEIFSGHKVKTKRTPATDGERHPIFRSTLSFQVPVQRLSHTSLVLTLVGRGKMRSSKTVGRAILGPVIYGSDSERSHWGRMIMSPLLKVEQWHELYL
ncbi:synaptotagmin-15-like [Oculina patagonica]